MHAKATRWTSAKVWGIVRILDKPPEAVAHAKDVGISVSARFLWGSSEGAEDARFDALRRPAAAKTFLAKL
jgi:hypothetical protein